MLKWLKKYYIGEGIKGPVRLQSKINAGKFTPGIYLITLSDNPHNILEIISSTVLLQRKVYDECPLVIGMAKGKSGAVDLAREILEHVYKKTGGFDVKKFLEDR